MEGQQSSADALEQANYNLQLGSTLRIGAALDEILKRAVCMIRVEEKALFDDGIERSRGGFSQITCNKSNDVRMRGGYKAMCSNLSVEGRLLLRSLDAQALECAERRLAGFQVEAVARRLDLDEVDEGEAA